MRDIALLSDYVSTQIRSPRFVHLHVVTVGTVLCSRCRSSLSLVLVPLSFAHRLLEQLSEFLQFGYDQEVNSLVFRAFCAWRRGDYLKRGVAVG